MIWMLIARDVWSWKPHWTVLSSKARCTPSPSLPWQSPWSSLSSTLWSSWCPSQASSSPWWWCCSFSQAFQWASPCTSRIPPPSHLSKTPSCHRCGSPWLLSTLSLLLTCLIHSGSARNHSVPQATPSLSLSEALLRHCIWSGAWWSLWSLEPLRTCWGLSCCSLWGGTRCWFKSLITSTHCPNRDS
jgi:hypothetical protein